MLYVESQWREVIFSDKKNYLDGRESNHSVDTNLEKKSDKECKEERTVDSSWWATFSYYGESKINILQATHSNLIQVDYILY